MFHAVILRIKMCEFKVSKRQPKHRWYPFGSIKKCCDPEFFNQNRGPSWYSELVDRRDQMWPCWSWHQVIRHDLIIKPCT